MIEDGKYVRVHYTGRLTDGTTFDSSEGGDPMGFVTGSKQVIPGFEDAVRALEEGGKTTVTIPSAEAYGDRQEELVQTVPREHAPEDVKEGQQVVVAAPNGMRIPAKIDAITDENVTLDLNHPLAGKDLTFDLELVDISDEAPEAEGCCGGACSTETPEGEGCCQDKPEDECCKTETDEECCKGLPEDECCKTTGEKLSEKEDCCGSGQCGCDHEKSE